MHLWNDIINMLNQSANNIIINKKNKYDNILKKMGINEISTLGQIIINTSGIVVDNIIRVYANGNDIDSHNIYNYNLELEKSFGNQKLIIADDIFGGLFAINNGAFQGKLGEVWYFAPDLLDWDNLGVNYSEFIAWISSDNINEFYSTFKWSNFYHDIKVIKYNQGILIYPFLWSNECNIEMADKKIVPFNELTTLNLEYKEKLNL